MGSTLKLNFPFSVPVVLFLSAARDSNLCLSPRPSCRRLRVFWLSLEMATFTSKITVTAEQLAVAPQLEPAFEHLLRISSTHGSVINTLRANEVVDRDTFVNMFDTESALKEGASDLGFDLANGGLPHKREFASVVLAWKTAKVMTETKLQTDAVARANGVPVTLLPCDWTSIVTEFKKKYGSHIAGAVDVRTFQ